MIVVETTNGVLPRYVAKYRPSVPILAIVQGGEDKNERIIRQLSACRGVVGLMVNLSVEETVRLQDPEAGKQAQAKRQKVLSMLEQAIAYAKEENLCKAGRKVLYLHGMTDDPN